MDIPFAGADNEGRVWLALRVRREDETGEGMRGAAVVDPNAEPVFYHHRGADREAGGLPLADEISAIDFDTENAWFATLSGLVRVGTDQAVVFGEARGVRGEVVTDAVVGSGVIWVASAEGLRVYDRSDFDYGQPANVQAARPIQLAMDMSGHLWATTNDGLLSFTRGSSRSSSAASMASPQLTCATWRSTARAGSGCWAKPRDGPGALKKLRLFVARAVSGLGSSRGARRRPSLVDLGGRLRQRAGPAA